MQLIFYHYAGLCESIVNSFRGKYLVLGYLKALLRKNGLPTAPVDAVMVDVEEVAQEIDASICKVQKDDIWNAASTYKLAELVIEFADKLGIVLSSDAKDMGMDYSSYLNITRYPAIVTLEQSKF